MTHGYDHWKLRSDVDDADGCGNEPADDGDEGPDEHAVCDRCGAGLPEHERRCAECVAAGPIGRAKE